MPKVQKTVAPQTRWQREDDNFRKQIRILMAAIGTEDKRVVAREAGLSEYKMYTYFETPSKLTKCAERQLESVFVRYGVAYDRSWGEEVAS